MDEKVISIWSNPEWRILFDVTRLNRVKPWEIKLKEIIKTLMEEFRRLKLIDLHSAGVAAYSAATIHRMKSELLLKADSPPRPREKLNLFSPPPIELPLTSEFISTTINDIVLALRAILSKRGGNGFVEESQQILEPLDLKLDEFLLHLEEKVEEFIKTLNEILAERDAICFGELVEGVDRAEAARRFILLLFAAARGVIELLEDEVTGRLVVKRVEDGV